MSVPGLKEMRALVCDAIRQRRVIEFRYGNEQHVVEPYCCGISVTDTMDLRGLQVARHGTGDTSSSWRLFTLGNMRQITITDRSFEVSPERMDARDKAMKEVYFSVATPITAAEPDAPRRRVSVPKLA